MNFFRQKVPLLYVSSFFEKGYDLNLIMMMMKDEFERKKLELIHEGAINCQNKRQDETVAISYMLKA